MVKIYTSKNKYLWNKNHDLIYRGLLISVLALLLVWVNAFFRNISLSVIAFLIFICAYKIADKFANQAGNYKIGIDAEKNILDELRKLIGNYTIFHNVKLPESYLDNDFIIISRNGIFNIEVKAGSPGTLLWKDCGQSMKESLALNNFLEKKQFVEPILVYAGKFAKVRFGKNKYHGTYIIRKEYLLDVIIHKGKTESISEEQMRHIEDLILSTGDFQLESQV